MQQNHDENICWVDSHCHPHLIVNEGDNLDTAALAQAVQNHIRMLCVSVSLSDYKILSEYRKLHPKNVMISLGEHPLHDAEIDWHNFAKLVEEDKNIVAIGETGFDFQGDLQKQLDCFNKHVEIACKHDLPIILHTRSGDGDQIETLTKNAIIAAKKQYPNLKGVFHCFSGTVALAEFALEMGWMISFSGIVTFKNAHSVREVAMHLYNNGYLGSILIETDSPYLAPQAVRGQQNVPYNVKYVGEFLADLFGISHSQFAKQVEANFDQLFKIRQTD